MGSTVVQSSDCLFPGLSVMECVLTYSISCCWLGCLHRLNVRPPVNISVTFAVLATMLNQRAGRKALIREASSVIQKPLLG